MAVGLSTVNFADKVLNHMLRAIASTAPAGNYVATHIGDPGAAGTTTPSGTTTRVAVTFGASSAGVCNSSNTPSWASWAGGSQTLSHISVWDALTVGTFLYSAVLTTPKAITNGDTFTLSSLSVSLAPLAA
jgi:hypothetical protein